MKTKIIVFISFFMSLLSTTYCQQKHALETWRYLLRNGKEPDIYTLNKQKQNNIKLTHELLKGGIWDEIFSNLVFVPGATYVVPYVNSDSPVSKQRIIRTGMISVAPFYMLNTEVTNKMYRFFLADSTNEKYKPHYNTDTSIEDANLSKQIIAVKKGKQYTLSNFEELDDYPAVGVTWEAALAFCKWLTKKATQVLDFKSDNRLLFSFRLPTEAEYEVAAVMNLVDENAPEKEMNETLSKNFAGKEKKYRINYGQAIKADGTVERKFDDDGFYFTNPVKEFRKGKLGLYGMLDNAAEWMLDVYTPLRNSNLSDYDAAVKNYNKNYYLRVVKGGSWYDKLFYITPYVRQKYNEIQGSERIGFRIAITDFNRN